MSAAEERLKAAFGQSTIGSAIWPLTWRGPGYDEGWQRVTREEARAAGEALIAAADELPDDAFRDPDEPREEDR